MTRIFVNLIRFDHSFWENVRQYKLLSCPLIEHFAHCLPHSPDISNHLVLLTAQHIYKPPDHNPQRRISQFPDLTTPTSAHLVPPRNYVPCALLEAPKMAGFSSIVKASQLHVPDQNSPQSRKDVTGAPGVRRAESG